MMNENHHCVRSGHRVDDPRKTEGSDKPKTHGYCHTCGMYTCDACADKGHQIVKGYCTFCGQFGGPVQVHYPMQESGSDVQIVLNDPIVVA